MQGLHNWTGVIRRNSKVKRTQRGGEREVGETKLEDAEFVGEKGDKGLGGAGFKRLEGPWLRGQVKMEQRGLATLDWQATQEMRELNGYETTGSKEGND